MGNKYGNTDPSVFQLRDIKRRMTKLEGAQERLTERYVRFTNKINKKFADILEMLEGMAGEEE